MLFVLLRSILASFSKFWSGKLQKLEVFAWSTCGKPSNKYPEMTTKTIATNKGRRRSTKEKENTSRSRMDVITPPPPSPPPKPPHRVERQMQVEASMCRKSRDGQNTAKTDGKCNTHRKTPKKTMRNGELSMFLDSAARRLWHFLLENTANTDAKIKPKFSFGRAKCQNSGFSTCQQINRHTPRGGRRTCCQQQRRRRRPRQRQQ